VRTVRNAHCYSPVTAAGSSRHRDSGAASKPAMQWHQVPPYAGLSLTALMISYARTTATSTTARPGEPCPCGRDEDTGARPTLAADVDPRASGHAGLADSAAMIADPQFESRQHRRDLPARLAGRRAANPMHGCRRCQGLPRLSKIGSGWSKFAAPSRSSAEADGHGRVGELDGGAAQPRPAAPPGAVPRAALPSAACPRAGVLES
jgi:hypothetical protein